MKNKLFPRDFEIKNHMRDIENCVGCKHSSNYDYNRYLTCNHIDRVEPTAIKDCSEFVCDKYDPK